MNRAITHLRERIPAGAGLGLRRELWHDTLANVDAIDFVEILVDDYLDAPIRDVRRALAPVRERFDIVAHGVRLSVASAKGLDEAYVDRVARLLDALEIEVYTEHLSFRRGGAHEVEQFVPVPFTERWADQVAENVQTAQRLTGRTIALENVTYLLGHPDAGIGEAAFVRRVAEQGDCGLLLDVTNLLINASNFDYSTGDFLETLPLDRVVLAHVAGGHDDGRFHIDSHSSAPPDEALQLLTQVAGRSALRSAALERDKAYPEAIEPLLGELESIRDALTPEKPAESRDVTLPRLTGSTERSPRPPEVPDADAVEPRSLQQTLAALLVRPGAFRRLRDDGVLPEEVRSLPGDETEAAGRYLLSFPPEHVRAFRKILSYKRREKIESVLPGTVELLGDDLQSHLSEYFGGYPDQTRTRVEEGRQFADFVLGLPDAPEPLRSMAAHEQAVLELKARPYRFWQFLRRPNLERTLHVHPRDLDDAIHRGTPLPPPQDDPIPVRYERRREGVWIEATRPRSDR